MPDPKCSPLTEAESADTRRSWITSDAHVQPRRFASIRSPRPASRSIAVVGSVSPPSEVCESSRWNPWTPSRLDCAFLSLAGASRYLEFRDVEERASGVLDLVLGVDDQDRPSGRTSASSSSTNLRAAASSSLIRPGCRSAISNLSPASASRSYSAIALNPPSAARSRRSL